MQRISSKNHTFETISCRRYFQYCLLQYSFEVKDRNFDTIQHGNSKRKLPYKQTAATVRQQIKESVASAKPSEAITLTRKQLGGTSKATSSGMLPRNIKQIQNIFYMKPSSSFTTPKDVLASLMEHCKTTLNDVQKLFIRRVEGAPEPVCAVGTKVAFSDLEQFCFMAPPGLNSVMTADPTFNFREFYFTQITFKNLTVIRQLTGQPKIDMGPSPIHQQKVFSSYHYFSSSLVGISPGFSELKRFGIDGEYSLASTFAKCFPFLDQLRYFIHSKKKVEERLNTIIIQRNII